MFANTVDFYPTPEELTEKMLEGIDFHLIQTVLEPEAGKGDLADAVKKQYRDVYWRTDKECDIDTVEISPDLRHILTGKGYRVVHDDFLTYRTYKHYDLIAMNPPFSDGDKHLLHAIELQRNGGKIVCLLNAETLKNPYSNTRKLLARKLEEYEAEVEYIPHAFANAERKTDIEVALVKIDIAKNENNSFILDGLRKEAEQKVPVEQQEDTAMIDADFIKAIVQRYTVEVRAGIKLITEWRALKPVITQSFKEEKYGGDGPIIQLSVKDGGRGTLENAYIRKVRAKYWEMLFTSEQFVGLFTSNLREKYLSRIGELQDYEFSPYNIYTIRVELSQSMVQGVEETILALFDEFSAKHAWYPEQEKNIHYFDGWATNKAWKVGEKVIIPLSARGYWGDKWDYSYDVKKKLSDIEKVFNYLDDGLTPSGLDIEKELSWAEKNGVSKNIHLKYFTVTFYKKGTCHIRFRNLELLKKFNLYGCQRKGWLPPSYGKKSYNEMNEAERKVIDAYEGEKEYAEVIRRKDYYIADTSKMLMLGA